MTYCSSTSNTWSSYFVWLTVFALHSLYLLVYTCTYKTVTRVQVQKSICNDNVLTIKYTCICHNLPMFFILVIRFPQVHFILYFLAGPRASPTPRKDHRHWWHRLPGRTTFYPLRNVDQVCQWFLLLALHLASPLKKYMKRENSMIENIWKCNFEQIFRVYHSVIHYCISYCSIF